LSPVGTLPAAFAGCDLEKLRQGALWALTQRQMVCELAAHTLASFDRQEWITLFWAYSERLKFFAAWLQQLWAESLGKRVDLQGQPAPRVSSPFFCVGASDQ